LLDQLQWITIAGKPENDRLRVVADGECAAEATARQLVDVMNGVAILAEGGLNDPRPGSNWICMREAYLELVKSADVSKIDRGDTKSVVLYSKSHRDSWMRLANSTGQAGLLPPQAATGKTPVRAKAAPERMSMEQFKRSTPSKKQQCAQKTGGQSPP